jgi:hypothetical protein
VTAAVSISGDHGVGAPVGSLRWRVVHATWRERERRDAYRLPVCRRLSHQSSTDRIDIRRSPSSRNEPPNRVERHHFEPTTLNATARRPAPAARSRAGRVGRWSQARRLALACVRSGRQRGRSGRCAR